MKGSKSEAVKVAVRVRPMNQKEREEQSTICVEVDSISNTVSVVKSKCETRTFQFDYAYPIASTQKDIYDQVAFPIVESIFQGYNGTIFAYGQTGCGKTYTMMGNIKEAEGRGIIPNAFDHIFGLINAEGFSRKCRLMCSFLEIYNEEVRDLLGKDPCKGLEVREDKRKGTYVKDLTFVLLKAQEEIAACLDRGNTNKHVGVTSMNEKSSRSHSLFTVYLEIEEGKQCTTIKAGKLNLVDLAGSERVGKTNATGQTLDEGKKINLSLTALGSVIDALSSNRKFIPYKDSKLTRLLADSLGGNTKTVMFANVSPASYNYEEILGTLRYASRAKLIKNTPKVNEDPKDALLRQYADEIKQLKLQLEGRVSMSPQESPAESNPPDDEDDSSPIQKAESNDQGIDPDEKQLLLEKIALLEKEMQSKKSIESERQKKQASGNEEESNKKFRKYRLQQLKNIDEMEKRIEMLQEKKQKEEEALQNDVSKLKNSIKLLQSEIDDLKYDNEKDRTDFIENIKDVNREKALYRGIIKYLLNDSELKRIIEASRYNDDNEEWRIRPFCFREKHLKLPNVRPYQIPDFIDNELSKRDMIFSDENFLKKRQDFIEESPDKPQAKGIRDGPSPFSHLEREEGINIPITFRRNGDDESKHHQFVHGQETDMHFIQLKKRTSKEKAELISSREQELTSRIEKGMNGGNTPNIFLAQKEKERYEEALNYNSRFNSFRSPLKPNGSQNAFNSEGCMGGIFNSPNPILKPVQKGKMFLDPIRKHQHSMSNKNNLEVSFKATLEISDSKGNKINISPGVNLNVVNK